MASMMSQMSFTTTQCRPIFLILLCVYAVCEEQCMLEKPCPLENAVDEHSSCQKDNHQNCPNILPDHDNYADGTPQETSRAGQLRSSYTYDYQASLRLREEGMKKYNYPYKLNGVDRRSGLSLQEYKDVYDGKWPVVVTDVVSKWPASNWTLATLREKYGDSRVTVTAVGPGVREGFAMTVTQFLNAMPRSVPGAWLYVQDELFLWQRPELRAEVLQHEYILGDLFQEFPAEIQPWDAFFLLGSTHSHSSLHIDPYNWTGTSAVLLGLKKWKLLLPGQDSKLQVMPGGVCGFPLECMKYDSGLNLFAEAETPPGLHYLETKCYPGDMLIIPTGWFHQAFNAEPTLAISGQLMNSVNHLAVLEEILKAGDVSRDSIGPLFDTMTPRQRVQHIMSLVPRHVLKRGAMNTQIYLDQINAT